MTGGIKLVRGLREKLREIEFHQSEAKNGVASCRAKVGLIHARLQSLKLAEKSEQPESNGDHGDVKEENIPVNAATSLTSTELTEKKDQPELSEQYLPTQTKDISQHVEDSSFVERIAKGESDAIAIRYDA